MEISSFDTQPYDVILDYLSTLEKMELPTDSLLLRQVSTIKEKKCDTDNNRFVAPYSKSKVWTKKCSDQLWYHNYSMITTVYPLPYFSDTNNSFSLVLITE